MRSNFAVPWRTPSRGQGWRCCRGPRTHVWRRHVDCVGRICVQVPRPTDDAQMRADSTSSAEREQSRPAGATARSHGSTAVESPVELPPSPQGSFLTLAFDAPHCERPELDTIGTIYFRPIRHVEWWSSEILRHPGYSRRHECTFSGTVVADENVGPVAIRCIVITPIGQPITSNRLPRALSGGAP
jgi:hypothetical protein